MKNISFYKFLTLLLLIINFKVFAKDFIIQGNEFTDDEILIKEDK